MEIALVTRANKKVSDWIALTHPIFKKFASMWKAEFVVIDNEDKTLGHHWGILQIQKLLNKFDRVLYMDTDIVINKNCPNIFDLVPVENIGLVYEDKGSRMGDRRKRIVKVQEKFGDVGWETGYMNIGVFLVSRAHKKIFNSVNGEYWTSYPGPEQNHIGWQINKYKIPVWDLGYAFNHMSMFSEQWNGYADRHGSHVIHYAGGGNFPGKDGKSAFYLAKADVEKIYGENNVIPS